jgi:hypothetical protein
MRSFWIPRIQHSHAPHLEGYCSVTQSQSLFKTGPVRSSPRWRPNSVFSIVDLRLVRLMKEIIVQAVGLH